jgi:receptor expression-enhancing protein 1/2/3/4
MYWSVLSCALLVESWLEFILVWIPFYAWFRLFFLLYLVLPQTQGARYLYETYLHPYLSENENAIEDFIASAHDRAKAAGVKYLRQAIELLKTKVLGMPPSEQQEDVRAKDQPQSYTQALLARFSMPGARWSSVGDAVGNTTRQDFFNMLAGAVSAVTGTNAVSSAGSGSYSTSSSTETARGGEAVDMSASGLVPEHIGGAQEKMSFIAQQKEKLAVVLNALDKEAEHLERTQAEEQARRELRPTSLSLDGQHSEDVASRPPSGQSMWSALSKSKSEVDFEKIEVESGSDDDGHLRRRRPSHPESTATGKGAWGFLGWGTTGTAGPTETGYGSGYEK